MNESNYSNKHLDDKFDFIKDKLDVIHEQTLKTNGRVSQLEVNVVALDNWKSFTKGAIAVLTMLVVPVLIFMVNNYLNK